MSKIKVNRLENTSTASGGIDIDSSGHVKVDGMHMPTAGALSNRNLVINGAFQIAQRGATSTANGYKTVDRWQAIYGGSIGGTQSQASLTSGTPYDEGFRKAFKVAVNTASNAANDYLQMQTTLEAQDVAQSGWKYEDPSHSLTCSFWVKSSLAGTYNVQYRAMDLGDFYFNRAFTVTANTWTKVTHTIPGHASLVFNNDNGEGLKIVIVQHYGTQHTDNSVSNNTWFALSGGKYFPDYAQNFGNTANATFEITGVQLEVGSKSTAFEHRSYGDELARCSRYFCTLKWSLCNPIYNIAYRIIAPAPVMEMRANPSVAYFNPANGTSNQTYEHSSGTARTISGVNATSDTAGSSTYFQISTNAVYGQYINADFDAEL